FDQYRQDQVIGFQHEDTDGRRHAGLRIWDRPDMPIDEWSKRCVPVFNLPEGSEKEEGLQQLKAEGLLSAVRIFVGKTAEGAAVIRLCDVAGRVRLRLAVNAEGEPGLEFYDEE